MPFDVDLNAGPLNSFHGFRMTWRSSLRWGEVWPGQTWRDRNGQASPRRSSPRERPAWNDCGGSEEFVTPSYQSKAPKKKPPWNDCLGFAEDFSTRSPPGQAQGKAGGYSGRRRLEASRSDPCLPVRLPCLTSSPESSPDFAGAKAGRLQRKRELGKSKSHSGHLPTIPAAGHVAACAGYASLQEVAEPTMLQDAAEGMSSTGRQRRRPRHGYEKSGKATVADNAIAQSRARLNQASGLLAESRCYGLSPQDAKARVRPGGTLQNAAATSTEVPVASSPRPAVSSAPVPLAGSDSADAATPQQTVPLQPADAATLKSPTSKSPAASSKSLSRSPHKQRNLQEISSMSTSILDELDGACKTLQERQEKAWQVLEAGLTNDEVALSDDVVPGMMVSGTGAQQTGRSRCQSDVSARSSARNRCQSDVSASVPGATDVVQQADAADSTPGPGAEAVDSPRDRLFSENPGHHSDAAVARFRGAFFRYTEPFSYDLDIANLEALVMHLGHGVTQDIHDGMFKIVKDITPYEYLDFDEFLRFMEKFLEFSHEENRRVFNSYDDDGSGELSVLELRKVMKSLAIVPYNGKLKEAVSFVDCDCNGQLDFDEFSIFLHEYLSNEGFTHDEVANFRSLHERLATLENGNVPLDSVADGLVLFYGVRYTREAHAMVDKLIDQQKKRGAKADVPEGVSFHDFLLLGREMRNLLYGELKLKASEFAHYDDDGNGCISEKELWAGLRKDEDGIVPLQVVVDEIFAEVVYQPSTTWAKGYELDFDQFFDFMLVYRQRECFLKAQVDTFWNVFNHFDEDASGTISTLELGDIFRHLGYIVKVDDIQHWVLQVDVNQSHTLDFKEFLHLMQLHRSQEIRAMRSSFENNCEDDSPEKLEVTQAMDALIELGLEFSEEELVRSLAKGAVTVDFAKFVAIADECRRNTVDQGRRMAGFTTDEIDRLDKSFKTFDKDHSGTIGCLELLPVLEEFGWKPKTKEDRDGIMGRLEKAREAAKQAGVEESTPDGSADVNFWEFVQLARMIQRHDETTHEEKMANLAHELHFTHHELAEFHEIFHTWATRSHQDDSDAEDARDDANEETCSKEYARRLVRSLGLKFTPERRRIFDDELNTLVPDGEQLDFQAFLRLMRWLVDTNFIADSTDGHSP